jgi:hypothetical protein
VWTKRVQGFLLGVIVGLLIILVLTLGGCAAGRTSDGTTVVGFPVGQDPAEFAEGASSALATIGGLVFGPPGAVAGTGLAAVITGLLGVNARNASKRREAEARAAAAESAKQAADAAWDESQRATEYARLRAVNDYKAAGGGDVTGDGIIDIRDVDRSRSVGTGSTAAV